MPGYLRHAEDPTWLKIPHGTRQSNRSGADKKLCSPKSPWVPQPPSSEQENHHCSLLHWAGLSSSDHLHLASFCIPKAVTKSPGPTLPCVLTQDSPLLPHSVWVALSCPGALLRVLRVQNPIQTPIIPTKTPCLGTGLLGTGLLGTVVITKQMKERVVPIPCQDAPTPVTTMHTAKDQSCCSQCWQRPSQFCCSCLHAHILARDPPTSPPSSTSSPSSEESSAYDSPCHCRTHIGRSLR